MEKYYKYIYTTIFLIILISVLTYFTGKNKEERTHINIKKNNLIIDNFELSKNVNESGDYYIIKAKKATFSANKKSVNMINCNIKYMTKGNILTFGANECTYILDKKLTLKNNIKGKYNNYNFETSPDGLLEYDMNTEKAKILNGAKMEYQGQSIKADSIYIDKKNEIIDFKSNIEAVYEIS